MNKEPKRIKVFIFDQQYSLVSDEAEDVIRQAAFLVDKYMQDISQKGNISDIGKVAVLAALQIAHEYISAKIQLDAHQGKHQELISLINKDLSAHLLSRA